MLANRPVCVLCRTPTATRCSLCKAVYYCTLECQGKHWKQGHRLECPRKVVVSRDKREHALCALDGTLAKPKKILFPYRDFLKFFSCNISKVPCGLINCGNSCYANVVLQCLASTRPLAAYLLHGMHQEACQREGWCFMCELEDHVQKAFNNQMPFSPIKILSRLRSIGNSLGYGRQEDAHEFMRLAVDCMQKICLDEAGGETTLDARTQETTLIQHIFGGYLQSQVVCCQCQQRSNLYENMLDLSVGIQGNVESLEDALKQFTSPEWLDGDNKYRCDRCNAYVRAKKRLSVHEAPNILTIALKRFQGGKFGKINKKVTFPEELDMVPYMSGTVDTPPAYKLYAVVVHVDMLNASYFGHYVCYVRAGNGAWFKVDDSKVKEVDQIRVMSQKAYMLLYRRSSPRPRPVVDGAATPSTSDSRGSCREEVTTAHNHPGSPVKSREKVIASRTGTKQVLLESSDSSLESGFANHMMNGTAQRAGKRRWQQAHASRQGGHRSPCSCTDDACCSSAVPKPDEEQEQAAAYESPDREGVGDAMECSLFQSSITSEDVQVHNTDNLTLVSDGGGGGHGNGGVDGQRSQDKRPRTGTASDDWSPRRPFVGGLDYLTRPDDEELLVAPDSLPATALAGLSENSRSMLRRGFLNRP
ncbi:ubiquitin carboxyl-terminal hydrolase 15 isoform X1 [Selaginella moellendorffii]|uniref:ubiquitin carboxyl-terminal hydrolase 15 isoform X1 n=1 Tax=Selaginella moellendorffii TaxID=88036 RepID=UPI000D1C40C5|nr:ubiquitin carboxyl-terminal hydrolase 15 isoform X1 [Selaginella moellendorffii]|eukprot:XP_024531505.1 ubiquitin carboxyl-terminal hydrolase 15 isoform X1 [Selaginella moellendorffii]